MYIPYINMFHDNFFLFLHIWGSFMVCCAWFIQEEDWQASLSIQRVQMLNTCSQEGRAQWRHEESQRSLWWRQQANCGWSRGWRSAASGQQEPPPSSWGHLHTDLVSLHQHGRVFVRHNRYVQVGPSSPLGAVIGRVNKSYKIQRQLRFGHRLQWLYAMLLDIQTTSLELPVMIENGHRVFKWYSIVIILPKEAFWRDHK